MDHRAREGGNILRFLTTDKSIKDFKASAFAGAFFVWIYCRWLFFAAETEKILQPPLTKKGAWVE